jgi:hypothetical protein
MVLKKGEKGDAVEELQRLLVAAGLPVAVDGDFGPQTHNAVRAFQAQHLDVRGRPLVVDGVVGPVTWWSLRHAATPAAPVAVIDYTRMPETGGSAFGRAALAAAIGELKAGAREQGGNNRGPWVRKYLNGLAEEGNSWCAAFTSWCFGQGLTPMPFKYSVGARNILAQFKKKGWAREPGSGYLPEPGDIVVWWRVKADGWQGHVGLVFDCRDGILYTIEGNKTDRVAGFDYVLSRMDRLLGFGHVPEA